MKKVKTSKGKLYISGLPLKDDFKNSPSFDIIWNLANELEELCDEETHYSKCVLFAGIKDFDVPELNCRSFKYQLSKVIDELNLNKTVLIHCFGGHGRTGMALALVKAYVDNISIDEALEFAKHNCNGPETKEQIEFVKNFKL